MSDWTGFWIGLGFAAGMLVIAISISELADALKEWAKKPKA